MVRPSAFLFRARLRRDAPIAAVVQELVPKDDDQRVAVSHKLLWTLFADEPARSRDFLWRESAPGEFYVLSLRQPNDAHSLFDIDPPKEFAPNLRAGQRLYFSLRANATVARKVGDAERSKRHDVVMDAIRHLPPGERASKRREAISEAGKGWLSRVLGTAGAEIDPKAVRVDGYRILRAPRPSARMQISTLDFDGVITVRDPETFVPALSRGFGRAKAFGCGLMLIKRA